MLRLETGGKGAQTHSGKAKRAGGKPGGLGLGRGGQILPAQVRGLVSLGLYCVATVCKHLKVTYTQVFKGSQQQTEAEQRSEKRQGLRRR